MMSGKMLSIVVAAYNMEAYLEKCLSSIADARSLEMIDVMVVDDGGNDGSLAIAQGFEQRYPGSFRAIHKENGGHGSVINYGIEHATGTYFKAIDGDDWVDPSALDGLIGVLEDADADIVASDYVLVEDGTERVIERRHAAKDPASIGPLMPIGSLANEEVLKIHSLTVRTALLRDGKLRVDEGCFYEDAELSVYPLAYSQTVRFDDHAVYQYRIGRAGQSVDIARLVRNEEQHRSVMMALLSFRDAHADLPEPVLDAIDQAIAYYTQNQYQIFLALGPAASNRAALREFDRLLRNRYPSIYARATKRSIWLIRKSRYLAFPLGCLAYRAYRALR